MKLVYLFLRSLICSRTVIQMSDFMEHMYLADWLSTVCGDLTMILDEAEVYC